MLHGRNRPFPRSRGAPGNAPTQAETTSWQAAVVTNAGTVSTARATIVNNFIYAEKQAGTWALTDDYWGLWGENVPQALTSLKQLRLAVAVSAPNFTGDRGYTFNGTTNYVNTGFVPSTHAVAMTGSNLRMAIYERNTTATGLVSMGAASTVTSAMHIMSRGAAGFISCKLDSDDTLISYTLPVDTCLGYSVSSRNGSTMASCNGYKNGSALAQFVNAPTFASTLVPLAIFIAAHNASGSAANFRPSSVGFACIGAALTAPQEQAQYNNVQAWAAAVGAQV